MKRFLATPALLLLLGASCSNPTEGRPPPPPPEPRITASVLAAGGEGVLRGTHLDRLSGAVSVDGAPVVPTRRTPEEIRFAMPPGRACEVAGRPVGIRAGGLSHTGRLEVPGALSLLPGESRVLAHGELAALCLQLPAGDERFVLTALNPSLVPASVPDVLLTVRSGTGSASPAISPAAAPVLVSAGRRPGGDAAAAHLPRPAPDRDWAPGGHRYSEAPVPFDPRYATAAPGDTLPWIDWWAGTHPDCGGPRERIPTIRIVVAAVSGKTVIAYEARSPHAASWESAAVRARLARAAEMMDRWALPAVRESMDREYAPLSGAGGRWFHVFRTGVPGWTVDNGDAPQTACRYSSEVPSTIGPDAPPESDAHASYLAGLTIHEYGHHAEGVYRIRRWGSFTPPMRAGAGWGGLGEVWAQTVQETAARLASGQATGARYAALDAPGASVPYADFYLNGYGESPEQSPWGITPGRRGGYYDQGTRLVMHLRERWGDAALGAAGDRLFERAQELPGYDAAGLAALVGLGAAAALDRWSLAEATDDLVDPAAAEARGLPQIRTWAPADAMPLPERMVSRTRAAAWTLRVGPGNYAALYVFADGEDAGKGVSLTFEDVEAMPMVVRITRLR